MISSSCHGLWIHFDVMALITSFLSDKRCRRDILVFVLSPPCRSWWPVNVDEFRNFLCFLSGMLCFRFRTAPCDLPWERSRLSIYMKEFSRSFCLMSEINQKPVSSSSSLHLQTQRRDRHHLTCLNQCNLPEAGDFLLKITIHRTQLAYQHVWDEPKIRETDSKSHYNALLEIICPILLQQYIITTANDK